MAMRFYPGIKRIQRIVRTRRIRSRSAPAVRRLIRRVGTGANLRGAAAPSLARENQPSARLDQDGPKIVDVGERRPRHLQRNVVIQATTSGGADLPISEPWSGPCARSFARPQAISWLLTLRSDFSHIYRLGGAAPGPQLRPSGMPASGHVGLNSNSGRRNAKVARGLRR